MFSQSWEVIFSTFDN